jgi:hypothetical protein
MSMIATPSLRPGERSLPSELRTARGGGFAARRLANGMRGVSGWGRGGGLYGLGQDDDGSDLGGDDSSLTDIDTGTSTVDLPPPDTGVVSTGTISSEVSSTPDGTPCTASDGFAGITLAGSCISSNNVAYSAPAAYTGPTSVPVGQTPPAAPSGYQWVTAANSAAQSLAKVLAISQGGTVVQLPNGQQIITGSAGSTGTSLLGASLLGSTGLSSILPWLLLLGGGFIILEAVKK